MTMTEPTWPDGSTEREQLAWAAGLFEGEGCFGTYRRKAQRIVLASLAMTDGDVVRRFVAIVGVGEVHGPRQRREGEQPLYEWAVKAAPDVLKVIELLSPWLGVRRAAKALEVAAVAATIGPHNGLRTHCRRGHLYEGENLVMETRKDGGPARRCKACRNEQGRERARKRLGIPPERWRV
jgi:hypothetical protein